jgi:hypothetical protein
MRMGGSRGLAYCVGGVGSIGCGMGLLVAGGDDSRSLVHVGV